MLYALNITITPFNVYIIFKWVHDSRSNNSRFMHKLCLSLHAMNKLAREETAYVASKTSLDNSNRA